MDHLDRMNRTLQRLERTVTQRLHECRAEAGESSELAGRARRLNDRIQMLHFKLRNAYSSAGRDAPSNLQQELQALAENDRDDAPPEFLCPVSQTLMVDPVKTADGNIYDRPSILEWFATFTQGTAPTSPLTNLPLASLDLDPQGPLRRRIAHFMKKGEVLPEDVAEDTVDSSTVAAPPDGDEDEAVTVARLRHAAPSPFGTAEDEALRRAKERALTRAPIWSSSVVPAGEENSRVLNMLRVHEGSEEDAVPLAIGGVQAPRQAGPSTRVGVQASAASRLNMDRARRPMVPSHAHAARQPSGMTSAAPGVAVGPSVVAGRRAPPQRAFSTASRAPVAGAPAANRRPDIYNFESVPPRAAGGGSASRLLRQRPAPLTSTRADPATPPAQVGAGGAGAARRLRPAQGTYSPRSPSAGSPRGRNLNSRQGARLFVPARRCTKIPHNL